MDLKENGIRQVTLYPGEYYASKEGVVISTILGSCVSACLYDPVKGVVGMNHFLLSSRKYARNLPVCITEAGRYGVNAMELLINEMFKLGAERRYLNAKVFGGGSFFPSTGGADNFCCVGEVNVRFILEFLKNDGIKLSACDLGGDQGRNIRFSSLDYSVLVRKTKKTGSSRLLVKEKGFWERSLKESEAVTRNLEIWT